MHGEREFDVEAYVHSFSESLGRAVSIDDTRRIFASFPIDSSLLPGAVMHEISQPSGTWIGTPNNNPARRGLYLHGGGYVAGGIKMYAGLVSRLAVATRSWIFVPNLPLAPEFRFPAAHNAARAAGWHVLRHAPTVRGEAESLFLAGDSCGAALALATAMSLRDDQGSNVVSAIIGLSPTLDMTASGDSYRQNAGIDKIVSRELTRQCAATYAPDTDPADPRLSPLFGAFTGLPPTLLQVGEREAVFDDSARAAAIARHQGCRVEVQMWQGMPHFWHLLAPYLPDADRAIARVGEFILKVSGDGR